MKTVWVRQFSVKQRTTTSLHCLSGMSSSDFFKDNSDSWVAPLPFRKPRRLLPNNREYTYSRLKTLRRKREKKPEMKTHFVEFMQNIFDSNHAERAPALEEDKECWYLPIMADIQQMFHYFLVREDYRDFLRFLWYRDNNLNNKIVDYRMRVHVFGNSPSPAVAIFGLRKAARVKEKDFGSDVRHFVERDFYVDDALKLLPTEAEAIDLLKHAQGMLTLSNLRLHKIASNKMEVMESFPAGDRAKDIKDLDLSVDGLPVQRSL